MKKLGTIKLGVQEGEDGTWHPVIAIRMGNGTEVEFVCTSSLQTEPEATEFCDYLFHNVFRKCGVTPAELLPENDEVVT